MLITNKFVIVEHRSSIILRTVNDNWDKSFEISKKDFENFLNKNIYDFDDEEQINNAIEKFFKMKAFL